MSECKHTPGPWWIDASRYGTIYIEASAVIDKRLLQEICAVGPTESGRGQQEANARLIAAAPELLEALRDCVIDMVATEEFYGEHPRAQEVLNAARAAIAKAGGETP